MDGIELTDAELAALSDDDLLDLYEPLYGGRTTAGMLRMTRAVGQRVRLNGVMERGGWRYRWDRGLGWFTREPIQSAKKERDAWARRMSRATDYGGRVVGGSRRQSTVRDDPN